MSEKKFTEEEMKKLRGIQQSYFEIQNSFGKVKIARMNLENQMNDLVKFEDSLMEKFTSNREDETNFVDEITKKYGDGNLNLETGTFTPSNENK
tara:strand:+ start:1090 stop:1371 length:282 start_codon:yes stop_codon:yes gene_type:complete